jgi:hypothetical protein
LLSKLSFMKLFICIIALVITAFLFSCKKSEADKPTTFFLRDKPLAEIKNLLVGNWKIHYKYGGITGNIKTPMTNSYFKVRPNDSIYLTLENNLFAADKAIFTRISTIFNFDAWIIDFSAPGGTPFSWIVDRQINDTLVLGDNHPNPEGYYMTKIP